ncbi:MAG TPA: hypothetical protein VM536_08580 [Chloroflexia bacterium]|nr:hypothetical protein [Chloroflexia bacterium]
MAMVAAVGFGLVWIGWYLITRQLNEALLWPFGIALLVKFLSLGLARFATVCLAMSAGQMVQILLRWIASGRIDLWLLAASGVALGFGLLLFYVALRQERRNQAQGVSVRQ